MIQSFGKTALMALTLMAWYGISFVFATDDCPAPREPLQYRFEGYSVALILEQLDSDLDKALDYAHEMHNVTLVRVPHATLFYYLTDFDETKFKEIFNKYVRANIKEWPSLKPMGLKAGVSEVRRAALPIKEKFQVR